MKKNKYFLIAAIFIFSIYGIAQIAGGKTLNPTQVKKKWGDKPFIDSTFRTVGVEKKAEMVYQILNNKNKYIGLDLDEIRKTFGAPDGFYFIDIYPAYIIQEGKSNKEETWQIVFLLNAKYKVREVIVHKNCCDN